MKGTFVAAALAGAALASPFKRQDDCSPSHDGEFKISIVNVSSTPAKREVQKRQLDGTLMLTLENGDLKDQAGRTGYIAANDQFQFDSPVQAGALTTTGWSLCSNGSLALEGNAVFWSCLSGDFYNLYRDSRGGQCAAIYMVSTGSGSSNEAPAPATQISDGQPQASTAVSQISDGQPQASTAVAPAPVTQISDGQPQASTAAAPITQISDGQVQASTAAAPITQISDGQVQASTAAAPITQISDGQVQASTAAPAVTQISDGQVQASTGLPAVTQISDGQVQATTAAVATFTGAADRNLVGSFALAAGIVGAVALL